MIGTPKELIKKLLELDQDKKYEIKEYKEKRSLDANAYYWHLINELANVLRISKEELHFKMLKEHSQRLIVTLPELCNPSGYFKYFEEYKRGKLKGQAVVQYLVYKPSSEMNSKEFSILLDGLVRECREMYIPILEDLKIKKMIEEMEKRD
ncbi:MAG: hypothetical protein WAQ09_00020 [Bacillota bacterium]